MRLLSISDGTSLRLCTAKSTSFCATALSISFSKIPFWSIVNNGLVSVSPFVVMVLISYSESGFTFFSSVITQFVWATDNGLPRAPTIYFNFSPILVLHDMRQVFCLDRFLCEHQIGKQLQIEKGQ